jgi:thymidylate kinase
LLEFYFKKKKKSEIRVRKMKILESQQTYMLTKQVQFLSHLHDRSKVPGFFIQLFLFLRFRGNLISLIKYLFIVVSSRLGILGKSRQGKLIIFIGLDGSGKSTLINSLSRRLKNGFVPLKFKYLGSKITLLQRIMRFARKKQNKDSNKKKLISIDRRPKLLRLFLTLYYAFEYLFRSIGEILFIKSQNNLVIYDRGFYDKLIIRDKDFDELYLKLLPKPDVVVFVTGETEKLWERKKEFPIDTYREMASSYENIAEILENRGIDVLRVNSVQNSEDQSANLVMDKINKIFKNYDENYYSRFYKDLF